MSTAPRPAAAPIPPTPAVPPMVRPAHDVPAAGEIEDADEELADKVRRYAHQADAQSRGLIARQPLVAVAAGLAVGALLGWVVKR